ncbi:30S ribosomal protein S3 [bacterium]|nr:30S ribosomal protein S3 [bacterium]MBU0899835.1 30S ribosomal protein S3 [bacterium]MBU1153625.1 30S ribosomal protein S3 [bacterium]MBU1782505.1 30S ribosomal protein S3 [bacterium]MBU2600262.1 30S ribosomal protein S3 [bacterium]
MGQKVHPYGFRVGYIYDWQSKWCLKKGYTEALQEDLRIRRKVEERLKTANISKVILERSGQKLRVVIHTARPGVVIGRSGSEIEKLKKELESLSSKEITLDVVEIKKAELEAMVVSQVIAQQLVKRVSYKRAMKRAITAALKAGALGIKVMCSGRLGGAAIARTEWYREGRLPLHTIRADIDYGFSEATTTYGQVGVKVWIFKGEIILKEKKVKLEELESQEESKLQKLVEKETNKEKVEDLEDKEDKQEEIIKETIEEIEEEESQEEEVKV